jgi:hypothetical protein
LHRNAEAVLLAGWQQLSQRPIPMHGAVLNKPTRCACALGTQRGELVWQARSWPHLQSKRWHVEYFSQSRGMHSQAHRACFAFTDLRTQHWSKKKKTLAQERHRCPRPGLSDRQSCKGASMLLVSTAILTFTRGAATTDTCKNACTQFFQLHLHGCAHLTAHRHCAFVRSAYPPGHGVCDAHCRDSRSARSFCSD